VQVDHRLRRVSIAVRGTPLPTAGQGINIVRAVFEPLYEKLYYQVMRAMMVNTTLAQMTMLRAYRSNVQ